MLGCRAYGQGPVLLVVRPAVNMLTTAARARPHGPEGCQSPSAAVCQVPGPAGCGYWLLANICVGQTLSTEDTEALPNLSQSSYWWDVVCGGYWSQDRACAASGIPRPLGSIPDFATSLSQGYFQS